MSVPITDLYKMFCRDEVTRKLRYHSEEILAKQDQMDFNVSDKMKKSIQNDVTEIVKVILLTNRLIFWQLSIKLTVN